MRFVAAGFFLVVFVLGVWLSKPAPGKTLPPSLPLPSGETNPPLKRISNTWPIAEGTKIWTRTNHQAWGAVTGIEERHEFDAGIEPGLEIKTANGLRLWIPRRTLQGLWIAR